MVGKQEQRDLQVQITTVDFAAQIFSITVHYHEPALHGSDVLHEVAGYWATRTSWVQRTSRILKEKAAVLFDPSQYEQFRDVGSVYSSSLEHLGVLCGHQCFNIGE